MWPFRHKVKIDIVSAGNAAAVMLPAGQYIMTWERQRMPDPGAKAYSWETLGLPKFNLVNSGYGGSRFWRFTNVPLHVGQAVPIVGIPRISGQIAMQPLIRSG